MEYTDAPSAQTPAATDKMICPRCENLMSVDAARCDKCGWRRDTEESAEGKASDAFAVLLSLIPGLGHIYKGHTLLGLAILFVATPLAVLLALLAATATAGFALLLLPLYFIAVMGHVYSIDDWVAPTRDLSEQY